MIENLIVAVVCARSGYIGGKPCYWRKDESLHSKPGHSIAEAGLYAEMAASSQVVHGHVI